MNDPMTKHFKTYVAVLFFAVLLLHISCANEKRSAVDVDNHIDFDTISVVERHHLGGDTDNPYCEIRISFVFPVSSENLSIDTLQRIFVENVFGTTLRELSPTDAVQRFVQAHIESYLTAAQIFSERSTVLLPNVQLSEFSRHEEYLQSDTFFSLYESLENEITFNQHGIIAFQVKRSVQRGDFLAFDSFRNVVIDLRAGEPITEDDIFHEGFEMVLQRLIIASLLDKHNVQTIDQLEELGFFGIDEIMPNGNFLLDNRGITYTFNKGEYSVDQIAAPVVFVPWRSVRTHLIRGGVGARLAEL